MFDYLLIGGGLQNGLIALALAERQPGATVALVEREARAGGNHTWCFHEGDVPAALRQQVEPLVCHRWGGYDVAFPAHARTVHQRYAAVTSERFRAVIASALGDSLICNAQVVSVSAREAVLRDGRTLAARVVIDARGPRDQPGAGYQKFVGRELRLRSPHGLDRPMLMDATVEQRDGFRFVYVLPLGPTRLLVEDTYFSNSPQLDVEAVGAAIDAYVEARGWRAITTDRFESGVLPLPWQGDLAPVDGGPLVAGYSGGWFHPVTGYSFPIAARLAALIADTPVDALFGERLRRLARDVTRQRRFCHRLNRMLFHWFAPEDRRNVLERFYRLPEATIRRFYALELTAADRGRILLGRPPRGINWRAALAGGVAS